MWSVYSRWQGDAAAGGGDGGVKPPDFDQLLAYYCQCSGEAWTDELENQLTFAKFFARQNYWRHSPPPSLVLHALAVGFGILKAPKSEPKVYSPEETKDKLRSLFPNGRIG